MKGLGRKGAFLDTGSSHPQWASGSSEATQTPGHMVSPLRNFVKPLYPAVCLPQILKFSFHRPYLFGDCVNFNLQTIGFLRVKWVHILITVGQYV